MTIVETILVFVGIPLALYCGIALLTMWPKFTRTSRYRPGQKWEFDPVWWSANPAGLGGIAPQDQSADQAQPTRTARGGARGSW